MTNLSNVCVGDSGLWNIMDTSVFLSVSLSINVDNIFNVLTLIDTIKKEKKISVKRKMMHCKYDLKCIACFSGKFNPHVEACFPFSLRLFLSPILLKAMFTKTVKAGDVLLWDSLTCQLTCHICTNLFLTANLQMLEHNFW